MANNIKKLYRSSTDKIIFGVCGGLAEYLEVDSLLVRIIFLFLIFAGGSGIFIYLILALLMPKDPNREKKSVGEETKKAAKELAGNAKDREVTVYFQNIAGIVIVLVGLSFLFKDLFRVELFGWLSWETVLALIIILFGINIIKNQNK